jgi:ATP-dependent DNA ligase
MKREACGLGLEGVVSKRKDGRYVSGRSDLSAWNYFTLFA